MERTRACDLLGIKYPIVQAPVNWITGADLADGMIKELIGAGELVRKIAEGSSI